MNLSPVQGPLLIILEIALVLTRNQVIIYQLQISKKCLFNEQLENSFFLTDFKIMCNTE